MSPQKKSSPKPKRIIDAHAHPDWHGHDFDKFIANMDEHGIEKCWLLTWECPTTEFNPDFNRVTHPCLVGDEAGPVSLARCLAYKERAPERFEIGYAPDPRKPEAIDKMKAAINVFGAKICGELKYRMMYDNPDVVRLFRYCGEVGAPVVVHIDYEFETGANYPRPSWWYGGGIEALERAMRQCPDTVFLGHAPGFWAHISADPKIGETAYPQGKVLPGGKVNELFDAFPNLYGDLSAGSGLGALQRDVEHAKTFIKTYQDRLLFARDCFSDDHRQFLLSLGLTRTVLDKLFHKNALKLVS